MFDVTATEDLMITRFDIRLFYVGFLDFFTDVEIYTKEGSYVGHEANNAIWTKHMDRTTIFPPIDASTDLLAPITDKMMAPILVSCCREYVKQKL